ncbi:MAG: ABC transporter permease [Peptococcaceae bacterium]|jgi:ABC-2 type transport system permease protein|nr:ABC transporter permease [Peptococcaceae bacterium]
MNSIRLAFSVYGQYIRVAFASAAAYRLDFFFTQTVMLAGSLLIPLLTVLIYANGEAIPGWTFHEALLAQAVFMLSSGLCAPFFHNVVWTTMERVREGTYDLLLLKPGSAVFTAVAGSFGFEYIGQLCGGAAMFAYAAARFAPIPAGGAALFALLFLMGVLLNLGCVLMMSAVCFKWVGNSRVFEIYDAVTLFGRYPVTIFTGALRAAVTYVIPVAMLGFFPATAILGRTTAQMAVAAVPCVLFAIFGYGLFRHMIQRYQSAGG